MNKLKHFIYVLISIPIIWINISLQSSFSTKQEEKNDILKQLHFLEHDLKENELGNRMQEIYPEGFVFINALYGLSWCELANSSKNDTELKNKAIQEALYAYNSIDQENVKWNFPKFLKPTHGAFYSGWSNYLLAKIFTIDTKFENSDLYKEKLTLNCKEIAFTYDSSSIPYLESYGMNTWAADNFVAISALSSYNKTFNANYQNTIDKWLKKVDQKKDKETLLIPHKSNYISNDIIENSRGSSMTLILRLLSEIDKEYGKQLYLPYKEQFVETTFGLPSIREYPKGTFGIGDIDSGPVILGVGFAATIVSIGMFSSFDNLDESFHQYQTINAFGFSTTTLDQKKYLYGALPIADAFIVWGRATALSQKSNKNYQGDYFWNLKFQIYSTLLLFLIWGMYFKKYIIK